MAVCCTKRQCEPDVVNTYTPSRCDIALICAIASPRLICVVLVAENVAILVTETHENCNHFVTIVYCAMLPIVTKRLSQLLSLLMLMLMRMLMLMLMAVITSLGMVQD